MADQLKPKTAAKAHAKPEEAAQGAAETETAAKTHAETAETPQGADAPTATDNGQTEKAQKVSLRHTTPYRLYRRAGLVLTQTPREYPVTHAQLATLTADTWVEVIEG